ncbi:hypothetical protein TIFTF001_015931 [Ficus carica]|uniref:Uncharacterized protein n=1 Tax=Ficus carica TaxID=3494 RepID=A0AA88D8B4_FICCA|nr:hypothetical protein TIFTF001_015931 [Ficus carica]
MAKFSASSSFLLALVLVYISGTAMVPLVGACYVSVVGGGCPNVAACRQTCSPCYRGVGRVAAYCRAAGGGIPYESCVCSFSGGAPCPPPGPPRCPNPPAGAAILTNETHV